jgi:SAM-dependent methyltransferase
MAEHMTLYDKAVFYDIVFDRDVNQEVAFLSDVYERHSGRAPESVLELACGPGYHARAFASRGLRAAGLDLSEAMIQLAQEKSQESGLKPEWYQADMLDFELAAPVDLAFNMFDGVDAMVEDDELLQHLRSVADKLNVGGLYLVDLTHPRLCSLFQYGDFIYRGRRGSTEVEIEWGVNNPAFDLVTGIADVELELRVLLGGQETVTRDRARERLLLPAEIRLLARMSGRFEVVAWYGGYDLDRPLSMDASCERMIAVLRRI